MLEKEIDRKLVKEVRKKGGLCIKFSSPGLDGVPDRMVLLPDGILAFVELKAPGKKPRKLQVRRMQQFEKLGFRCFVLDNMDGIGGMIDAICSS